MRPSPARSQPILWLDLETTGLDVNHDRILEVAAVLTNGDLKVIESYHAVLKWPKETLEQLITEPEVWEMHSRNGLIDACVEASATLPDVSGDLLRFLDDYVDGQVILAGSGVAHFDLLWLREWLPRVAERLAYYTLDIGIVRRFLQIVVGLPEEDRPQVPHRALDDVLLHIEEARAYRDRLREAHDIANGKEDGQVEHLAALAENTQEIASTLARIGDAFALGELHVKVRKP